MFKNSNDLLGFINSFGVLALNPPNYRTYSPEMEFAGCLQTNLNSFLFRSAVLQGSLPGQLDVQQV
jgi:hypothetical protein